ncbi:MAG: hypothetical protein AVDCRST_MAG59-3196, partial [uncultured Thermomicrobiales bacterium]
DRGSCSAERLPPPESPHLQPNSPDARERGSTKPLETLAGTCHRGRGL